MHAIVLQGDGSNYETEVFAYVCPSETNSKMLEQFYDVSYYILLDSAKHQLIRQPEYWVEQPSRMIHQLVLLTDGEDEGWQSIDNGVWNWSIHPILKNHPEPSYSQTTLADCISMDSAMHFSFEQTVESQSDVDHLLLLAGGFHDGYTAEINQADGVLSILMADLWGGKIKLCFSGDVQFSLISRTSPEHDPFWFEASLWREQDMWYFADDTDIDSTQLDASYAWVRAQKIEYKFIPNRLHYAES